MHGTAQRAGLGTVEGSAPATVEGRGRRARPRGEEALASRALGALMAEVREVFGLTLAVQLARRTRRPDLDEPDATPRLWVWSVALPAGGAVAVGMPGVRVEDIRLRAKDLAAGGPRPRLTVDGRDMVWQQAIPVIAELLARPPGSPPATMGAAAGVDATGGLAAALTRAAQLLGAAGVAYPGLPPLTRATLDAPPGGGPPTVVLSPPAEYIPAEQVRAVRRWAHALQMTPVPPHPAGVGPGLVVEARARLPVGGTLIVLCTVPAAAAGAAASPVEAYTEAWTQ